MASTYVKARKAALTRDRKRGPFGKVRSRTGKVKVSVSMDAAMVERVREAHGGRLSAGLDRICRDWFAKYVPIEHGKQAASVPHGTVVRQAGT